MDRMTSNELHESVRKGLGELSRKLASGEIGESGRFWTDDELEKSAATSGEVSVPTDSKESAA